MHQHHLTNRRRRPRRRPSGRVVGPCTALLVSALALAGCGRIGEPLSEPGGGDGAVEVATEARDATGTLTDAQIAERQAAAADAMAATTSVRFSLRASGDDVFIDPLRTLALRDIEGRFVAPADADALLTVGVSDSLTTRLGAIALGPDAWLSNPVTGVFEPLPEAYGVDPSRFFDPEGGWRPLIAGLTEVEHVGDDDDGVRLRGSTAPGDLRRVTAGLAPSEGIEVDLWLEPGTDRIVRATFTTDVVDAEADGGRVVTDWELRLGDYGEAFEIRRPEGS